MKVFNILIVDDHQNWRVAMRMLLEEYNFNLNSVLNIYEVSNYHDAISFIHKNIINLLICDIRLNDDDPLDINGKKVLQFAKWKNPLCKTIIITGYPDTLREKPSEADALFVKNESIDIIGFKKCLSELFLFYKTNNFL